MCPASRAKNWQAWFASIWCQCYPIRLGRLEGEKDARRFRKAVLTDFRDQVEALRTNFKDDLGEMWNMALDRVITLIDGGDDDSA